MKKEIRFKNDYEKLPIVWDGTQSTLIACYPEKLNTLVNKYTSFFNNDTKLRFEPYKDREQYYPVTHEDLLVLIFIHLNTGILFSTLRHNTEDNFELYINSIGETFKLVKK